MGVKLNIVSAGPDNQFGTADDIEALTLSWPYFQLFGKIIDRAVKETYASSGACIRDFDALNAACFPADSISRAFVILGAILTALVFSLASRSIRSSSRAPVTTFLVNSTSRSPYGPVRSTISSRRAKRSTPRFTDSFALPGHFLKTMNRSTRPSTTVAATSAC